jgi:hypothetical protein
MRALFQAARPALEAQHLLHWAKYPRKDRLPALPRYAALHPQLRFQRCPLTPSKRRGIKISPLNQVSSLQRHFTMNSQELKNYLADSPPSAVNLEIKKHFEALEDKQKRYAHYISRYV